MKWKKATGRNREGARKKKNERRTLRERERERGSYEESAAK